MIEYRLRVNNKLVGPYHGSFAEADSLFDQLCKNLKDDKIEVVDMNNVRVVLVREQKMDIGPYTILGGLDKRRIGQNKTIKGYTDYIKARKGDYYQYIVYNDEGDICDIFAWVDESETKKLNRYVIIDDNKVYGIKQCGFFNNSKDVNRFIRKVCMDKASEGRYFVIDRYINIFSDDGNYIRRLFDYETAFHYGRHRKNNEKGIWV